MSEEPTIPAQKLTRSNKKNKKIKNKAYVFHFNVSNNEIYNSVLSELIDSGYDNVNSKTFLNTLNKQKGIKYITIVAVQKDEITYDIGYAACSSSCNFSRKFGKNLAEKRALIPDGKEYSYGRKLGTIQLNDAKEPNKDLKDAICSDILNKIKEVETNKKIEYITLKAEAIERKAHKMLDMIDGYSIAAGILNNDPHIKSLNTALHQ